jgi:hypothetical protein
VYPIDTRSVAHDSPTAHVRQALPLWIHALLAALTGLALRLFLVLHFPAEADDSVFYEELARNWLDAHIYGLTRAGNVVPSDMRAPGYPAFLAVLYQSIGRGQGVILLAQAGVDLVTCFLVAWLASRLVPEGPHRRRVWLTALWFAATCPFVANYAAVPLTEVLATFLTAVALIPLVGGCTTIGNSLTEGSIPLGKWFTGGLLVGLGTLVRPETPLLLISLAAVLVVRWRRPEDWGKLVRAGAVAGFGMLLALLPWGARNWESLHEAQFLAPRYATTAGEYVPRGFHSWTATWLVRYREVYLVPWKIDSEPVPISDLPSSAFDSPEERARTAALMDRYNETVTMTPEIDGEFREIGRERTARHPLRTYLYVPLERAATLWFTPRVDLLPFSGHLWPLRQQWSRDPADVAVTIFLGALNFFYVGLAAVGVWRFLQHQGPEWVPIRLGVWLLVAFVLLRTAFFTTVETPEPRYVLECFPAMLALGALAWNTGRASDPRGPRAARGGS